MIPILSQNYLNQNHFYVEPLQPVEKNKNVKLNFCCPYFGVDGNVKATAETVIAAVTHDTRKMKHICIPVFIIFSFLLENFSRIPKLSHDSSAKHISLSINSFIGNLDLTKQRILKIAKMVHLVDCQNGSSCRLHMWSSCRLPKW